MSLHSAKVTFKDSKKVEIGGLMKINEQLLSALLAALEWIDAVPSDTVLPAMPGI
ncbi:hypothetical protein IE992_29045 [Klebsiella pneumoniae]|uniref:Uncharacterized protein n=1 Tax=Klebsiella pneumoniae TaxID=573 RepID=A0A927DNZ1_KLEPN|nr:hypothetical protein [Klebsiella pneumoniae]MBD3715550.1 hypothetical protein [Klebsiella pneumoniae]MBD3721758.1 hypothetical protein [Klebsiella pneumoniae]